MVKAYQDIGYQYSEDHTIQCPYYKDNGASSIRCEGAEEKMSNFMTFDKRDRLIEYKDKYCRCMNYRECLWAAALDRKWGY